MQVEVFPLVAQFVQHELEHQQEQLVAERDELQRRLQASQAEAEGGEQGFANHTAREKRVRWH